VIIRQKVKAISCQSRAATGVRVQRLDEDDAIVAVALVPPANEEESLALSTGGEGEGLVIPADEGEEVPIGEADSVALPIDPQTDLEES
jgi:hypothetical protein